VHAIHTIAVDSVHSAFFVFHLGSRRILASWPTRFAPVPAIGAHVPHLVHRILYLTVAELRVILIGCAAKLPEACALCVLDGCLMKGYDWKTVVHGEDSEVPWVERNRLVQSKRQWHGVRRTSLVDHVEAGNHQIRQMAGSLDGYCTGQGHITLFNCTLRVRKGTGFVIIDDKSLLKYAEELLEAF